MSFCSMPEVFCQSVLDKIKSATLKYNATLKIEDVKAWIIVKRANVVGEDVHIAFEIFSQYKNTKLM